MEEREDICEAGDTIYTTVHPDIKMLVRRYRNRIYNCKFANDLE